MAKKRTASRKGAARKKAAPARKGGKKKAVRRGGARKRKAAVRAAAAPAVAMTPEGKVDFAPLKAQIRRHIEALERLPNAQDAQVQSAIRMLEDTRMSMSSICTPTMTIPG